jgi:uncharacterized membrane protein YphA (DoxX/SURF4 family)
MLPSANVSIPYSADRPHASVAHTVTRVLTLTYGIVPIVAGLDKFTNLLTNWEAYLSPSLVRMLPFSGHTFMLLVGIIEIVAGILLLLRPRIGAWVVMAWLISIGLTLLTSGHYLDVAVRDFTMAVGAWALARLSAAAPTQEA